MSETCSDLPAMDEDTNLKGGSRPTEKFDGFHTGPPRDPASSTIVSSIFVRAVARVSIIITCRQTCPPLGGSDADRATTLALRSDIATPRC